METKQTTKSPSATQVGGHYLISITSSLLGHHLKHFQQKLCIFWCKPQRSVLLAGGKNHGFFWSKPFTKLPLIKATVELKYSTFAVNTFNGLIANERIQYFYLKLNNITKQDAQLFLLQSFPNQCHTCSGTSVMSKSLPWPKWLSMHGQVWKWLCHILQ